MIFNSLGSNYDLKFVIKSLLSFNDSINKDKLESFLNKKYGGKTTLLYKGREAIKLGLSFSDLPKGSRVGITGFTCYAVYQAVEESGYTPVYLDITGKDLNFDANELQKKSDLSAVIVQNTLGISCDMEAIKNYCKRNKIILIEDLAHCAGLIYKNGQEAGTIGDFTALSFSQDKMIDAISGGALVVRNKKYQKSMTVKFEKVDFSTQLRDKLYPVLTFIIRKTYLLGLGKILHLISKKFKLLSNPMPKGSIAFHALPFWYQGLVLYQFSNLKNSIEHREKIVRIYQGEISNNKGLLRFPLFINDRKSLINNLKKVGIYVSDIWYDSPVAPKRFLKLTNYKDGISPISEKVSKNIINLPTHINVSEKMAYYISTKVKL